MTYINIKPLGICTALAFVTCLCASEAHGADIASESGDYSGIVQAPPPVLNEVKLSDNELSLMRGGFVSPEGVSISFGLSTQTAINGIPQGSFNITGNNLNGSALPANIRQMIQVGQNNTAPLLNNSTAIIQNTVLTLIQNTANGAVIQNKNVLDIAMNNLNTLRAEQVASDSRFAQRIWH